MSIPRLELKAALLLSHVMAKVSALLTSESISVVQYAWSDSKVALAWIKASPDKWKLFVRNRVAAIQELIPPADIVSRGCVFESFIEATYWFSGPEFLQNLDMGSVIGVYPALEQDDLLTAGAEEKKLINPALVCVVKQEDWWMHLADQYSNFSKSFRVLCWILRYVNSCRGRWPSSQFLSGSEISASEGFFVRHVQQLYFSEEINCLKSDGQVSKRSQLYQLT